MTPNPERHQKDKFIPSSIESAVFGTMCGESTESTYYHQYRLNVVDSAVLSFDTTHKRNSTGGQDFAKRISEKGKVDLALDLLRRVPNIILQGKASVAYYHCSNCPVHYCSLFFEVKTKTTTKRVQFSYSIRDTVPEIEEFRRILDATMEQLGR